MQKGQPRLPDDVIQRLRAGGFDPEDMSQEQLEAFESLEEPGKYYWFAKLFIYLGGVLEVLAVLSIFSADWLLVLGYGIVGLIVWYVAYRVQTRVAARRFLQASIRKDITTRLGERKILAQRITYVSGKYSQLKLLDGSSVFVQTLPQSLKVSRMVLKFIPTGAIWEYKLPFQIRTPTQATDIAKKLLDLVLQSIEHCKTLTELQQKLNTETGLIVDNFLYRDR